MKKRTKAILIALSVLTTSVSAKEERKPLVQGALYTQQSATVHYDNKRNGVEDRVVRYERKNDGGVLGSKKQGDKKKPQS